MYSAVSRYRWQRDNINWEVKSPNKGGSLLTLFIGKLDRKRRVDFNSLDARFIQ